MYLSYEEYQNMGGTLNETAFTDFEIGAEFWINWCTFNRLKVNTDIPDEVKKCVYKLIGIAQIQQQALSLGQPIEGDTSTITSAIASQSNDGVSISYNTMSATTAYETAQEQVKQTVQMYLQGVVDDLGRKLLYRGLYPNE
jgi:hypothetical protein